MLRETFKRGQVEWAIWGVYTQQRAAAGDPPPAFHTRLKRLLEADRDPANPPARDQGYAFASTAGNDAVFLAYDAFSLALALELLGSGFKPSEIIALLRRSRGPLERQFNAIMKVPRPQRMRAPAKAWPSLPSHFEAGEEPRRWTGFSGASDCRAR